MFFALVPKSNLGQLVISNNKGERDKAAEEARKSIGGGAPIKGICSGPANAKLFQLFNQACFRIARRRLSEMLVGRDALLVERFAHIHGGQARLLVFVGL